MEDNGIFFEEYDNIFEMFSKGWFQYVFQRLF